MSKRGSDRRGGSRSQPRGTEQRGSASRAPSQRQLRVGEELRHRLAEVFERETLNDPALEGVAVTVTEVKVSPDLTNATAFVTPLGGGAIDAVVKALNHAAGYLRHRLAGELDLRVAPRLAFAADRSFETASRIEAILRHPKVAQDLEAPDPEPDEGGGNRGEKDGDGDGQA